MGAAAGPARPRSRAAGRLTSPARVALFADAYGMDADQRAGLMPLAIDMVHNFHLSAREAAKVDPVFARFWDEGVREKMPRAEAWLQQNADRHHARRSPDSSAATRGRPGATHWP